MSDVFSPDGDAEGQYTYPTTFTDLTKTEKPINFSFDLSDYLLLFMKDYQIIEELKNEFMDDDDCGDNIIEEDDDFDLYLNIAKNCHNAFLAKS